MFKLHRLQQIYNREYHLQVFIKVYENRQRFVALCFKPGVFRIFHDYRTPSKSGFDCNLPS